MTTLRCAIYTRKSSQEGPDQAFNSLDAQREAGTDYVRSQRHAGWVCLPDRYDDGGYSGGSTDRPGLQRLLEDIRRGRADAVVVYKVDRLSRSLADFARLMQIFDEHSVSFVSVTQQFNTTTSMGRLTLNMLLSFAQFERAVAGERIRDKIAATKRRGLWVCGQPPMGYAVAREGEPAFTPGQRALRIVDQEAALVRAIYAGYLELGSLVGLASRLNQDGHRTKRTLGRDGTTRGGRPRSTAHLHRILTNPIYIGKITHRRGRGPDAVIDIHDGLHEPIIDPATWGRVRAAMDLDRTRAASTWTHTHLLKGKLRTHEGHALSPGSTQRPRSKAKGREEEGAGVGVGVDVGMGVGVGVRRVRYYISQKAIKHGYDACPIKSVNARHLDDLIRAIVIEHAGTKGIDLRAMEPAARDRHIRGLLRGVTVAPDRLEIDLDDAVVEQLRGDLKASPTPRAAPTPNGTTPNGTAANDSARHAAHARPARDGRSPRARGQVLQPDPPHAPDPDPAHAAVPACLFTPEVTPARADGAAVTRLSLAIRIKRLDGKRLLLAPNGADLLTTPIAAGRPTPRPHLVRALAQAHAWRDALLEQGASNLATRPRSARRADPAHARSEPPPTIASIARAAGVTSPRISLLLPLAHLSPNITRAVLDGTIAPSITLRDLLDAASHPDWDRQAESLGPRSGR